MTYSIVYTGEFSRVIAAVILESRQLIPAIKNKGGFEVMDYFDLEAAKVTDQVLPYKIEADNGSLVGYFSVQVAGIGGTLLQKFIRPNFQQVETDISQKINSFIFNGDWKQDYLFGELK